MTLFFSNLIPIVNNQQKLSKNFVDYFFNFFLKSGHLLSCFKNTSSQQKIKEVFLNEYKK